jgi:hypothetical protein
MRRSVRLIAIVLLTAVALLAVDAGTRWVIAARRASAQVKCLQNLRQIDGAIQQWALENFATANAEPRWVDIYPYGGRHWEDWPVHCPAGGFYGLQRVGDGPLCSIAEHTATWEALATTNFSRSGVNARPLLTATKTFRQALRRLMIVEAKRVATELNLDDPSQITEINVNFKLSADPVIAFSGYIGSIRTTNYAYSMHAKDSGVVVSGVFREFGQFWSETNCDTNGIVQLASEFLARAGTDINALNRDCVVEINPWFRNVRSSNDPTCDVVWRQRQDTFYFRAGHVCAQITFVGPARLFSHFSVHDSKYLWRQPLEKGDMVSLLTPENSHEALLEEMVAATNYVSRIRRLQTDGIPEPLLRKAWSDFSAADFPTNVFLGSHSL